MISIILQNERKICIYHKYLVNNGLCNKYN